MGAVSVVSEHYLLGIHVALNVLLKAVYFILVAVDIFREQSKNIRVIVRQVEGFGLS